MQFVLMAQTWPYPVQVGKILFLMTQLSSTNFVQVFLRYLLYSTLSLTVFNRALGSKPLLVFVNFVLVWKMPNGRVSYGIATMLLGWTPNLCIVQKIWTTFSNWNLIAAERKGPAIISMNVKYTLLSTFIYNTNQVYCRMKRSPTR